MSEIAQTVFEAAKKTIDSRPKEGPGRGRDYLKEVERVAEIIDAASGHREILDVLEAIVHEIEISDFLKKGALRGTLAIRQRKYAAARTVLVNQKRIPS